MSIDSGEEREAPIKQAGSEVKETVKQEASHVASSAADSAKQVAGAAATQAKAVAEQAKEQVSTLLERTRHEVRETAEHKSQQAAGGLRAFADQLRMLANGQPDQAGPLQRYVQDAQDRVSTLASRLENEGPQSLLDDVTRFARRRPGVFLAAAAGAGFALGRLVRAGAAASADQHPTDDPSDDTPPFPMPDVRSDVAPYEVATPLGDAPPTAPTSHATALPPLPGTTPPAEGR